MLPSLLGRKATLPEARPRGPGQRDLLPWRDPCLWPQDPWLVFTLQLGHRMPPALGLSWALGPQWPLPLWLVGTAPSGHPGQLGSLSRAAALGVSGGRQGHQGCSVCHADGRQE